MKIAINRTHRGKNPKGQTARGQAAWFGRYNGEFKNHDLTPEELALAIAEGHGYTTQHRDYRRLANFVAGQHIGLDFDILPAGTTLSTIVDRYPFIADYAGLLHTTASHTPEDPRIRVLFFLDRPIHDAEKYTELAEALLDKFSRADKSCSDACRLFFGAEDCEILLSGRVLTLGDAAHELVFPYRVKLERAKASREAAANQRLVVKSGNVPAKLLESHSRRLLNNVYNAPDGEKHRTLLNISRTFGGYVSGQYYSEVETVSWLRAAIDSRGVNSQTAAYATIDAGIAYGKAEPLYFDAPAADAQNTPTTRPGPKPDHSWQKDYS